MSALIDWSYDLLAPPEQRLFASLSIFAGGCTLSEATAVCGDEGSNDLDILDRLSSLVDKSLVIADRTTSEPRYQLLQTFQRYGAEKLAARGETWAIAHRHAHVYTTLAERLDDDYDVAPNAAWFARVEREIDNFESALDWTLQAGHDIVLGQRLAGALRPVWTVAEGGRRWVQLALDLLDERTPRPIAARLHFADIAFRSRAGEHAATVAACERLALAYGEIGDPLRRASALQIGASTLVTLDRVAEAEPLIDGVLDVARAHKRSTLIASALQTLARIRFANGDVTGGRAALAEALTRYDAIGAERHAANIGGMLAEAEFRAGNADRAVQLATNTLRSLRKLGWTIFIVQYLANITAYCIALDRWADAREYAREALEFAHERRDSQGALFVLQHIAAIAILSCDERHATSTALDVARILGYIDASMERVGSIREYNEQQEDDRVRRRLAAELSVEELASRLAEGTLMTAQQARDLALSL